MKNITQELDKLLRNGATSNQLIQLIEQVEIPELRENLYLKIAETLTKSNPRLVADVLQEQNTDKLMVARIYAAKQLGLNNQVKDFLKQLIQDRSIDNDLLIRISTIAAQFGAGHLIKTQIKHIWKNKQLKKNQYPLMLDFSKRIADWGLYESIKEELQKLYLNDEFRQVNETPRNNLLWCGDEHVNYKVIKAWFEKSHPTPQAFYESQNKRNKKKKRIGYMSSDFRNHPTSSLIKGLIREHDKSKFSLIMFCSGWDDDSDLRKEIESYFDEVYSITNLSDESAAELIKKKDIDVLMELNGPTASCRLGILAKRPAKVLVGYLGWPGSYFNLVDFIIVDDYVVPKSSEIFYLEKLIKIQKTYQVNDYFYNRELGTVNKADFGFKDQDIVLGVFNQLNKIGPDCWITWMDILKKIPNAKLWMFNPTNQLAVHTLKEYAKRFNIDVSRIVFAKHLEHDKHLDRLQICDLMLDTWPYSGHTTTSDAIYAGVPVLALEGSNFPSRVSGGLLLAAGLDLFIRKSVEDYVSFGVEFLENIKNIKRAKIFIKNISYKSNIFDTVAKARQIESAFETILDQHKRNIKFSSIYF
jgi:predicted O-linked N-acetylglucosamine transferase (SPINDLY family)